MSGSIFPGSIKSLLRPFSTSLTVKYGCRQQPLFRSLSGSFGMSFDKRSFSSSSSDDNNNNNSEGGGGNSKGSNVEDTGQKPICDEDREIGQTSEERMVSTNANYPENKKPEIHGIPSFSLMDERIENVRLRNLQKNYRYALRLHITDNKNANFMYRGNFFSNNDGEINLQRALPVHHNGGSELYTRADSMGMFRMASPEPNYKTKFRVESVEVPYDCTLSCYDGWWYKRYGDNHYHPPVATKQFKRLHMAEGVERREVRDGRLRATFFKPPPPEEKGIGIPTKKRCIITLEGPSGVSKVYEDVAALLASRGFPALALAYSNRPHLDMEYFEEAIDYVTELDECASDGVGLWGIADGGEVCLSICGLFSDRVRAVAVANTMLKPYSQPLVYKKRGTKGFRLPQVSHLTKKEGKSVKIDTSILSQDPEKCVVPFWKTDAPFLYIVGEENECINSSEHANRMWECLQRNKFFPRMRIASYPGMGHLVGLPFSPVFYQRPVCYLHAIDWRFLDLTNREAHARGQEQAWEETLNFYHVLLCTDLLG